MRGFRGLRNGLAYGLGAITPLGQLVVARSPGRAGELVP